MAIMHLQPCAHAARASASRTATCRCACAQPAAMGSHRRDVVVAQRHVVRHLLAGVDEHNLLPAAHAVLASAPCFARTGVWQLCKRGRGVARHNGSASVRAPGDDFSLARRHVGAAPAPAFPQPALDCGRGFGDAALDAAHEAPTA